MAIGSFAFARVGLSWFYGDAGYTDRICWIFHAKMLPYLYFSEYAYDLDIKFHSFQSKSRQYFAQLLFQPRFVSRAPKREKDREKSVIVKFKIEQFGTLQYVPIIKFTPDSYYFMSTYSLGKTNKPPDLLILT